MKNNLFTNPDIKKNIIKYLRKNAKKKCVRCKKICVWNKKIRPNIEIFQKTYCIDCYPYPIVCIL